MKLSEALAHAKAEMEAAEDAEALHETLGYLVDAVEEHLAAERKSAETLLCLADIRTAAQVAEALACHKEDE